MHEIIIDEAAFEDQEDVHSFIASELGFPDYYGGNLDALNDCLGDLDDPCAVTLLMADTDAEASSYAAWFPKLCRTFLRASRDNEGVEVFVHAASLRALGRLAACPGLAELLDEDMFVTQGLVACVPREGE